MVALAEAQRNIERMILQSIVTCPGCGSAPVLGLHWRTGHGPIGAENATIPTLGLQFGAAAGALVEILASVGRHRFLSCGAAPGTSNDRLKDHAFNVPLRVAETQIVRLIILSVARRWNSGRGRAEATDSPWPPRRSWPPTTRR